MAAIVTADSAISNLNHSKSHLDQFPTEKKTPGATKHLK